MAGAFIVIEVDTLSSGMSDIRIRISSRQVIDTPTLPTSPSLISSSAARPSCVGRSKATDRPFCPRSNRSLNLSLVSSALLNPAYCRMVHSRERYIESCIPRVYGGFPDVSGPTILGTSMPPSVRQSSLRWLILLPRLEDMSYNY